MGVGVGEDTFFFKKGYSENDQISYDHVGRGKAFNVS